MYRGIALLLPAIGCLVLTSTAFAHSQGSSYATLDFIDGRPGQLRIDIAPIDLQHELDLDGNGDGRLTWSEVSENESVIQQFVRRGVAVRAGASTCELLRSDRGIGLVDRLDQKWLQVESVVDCPAGTSGTLGFTTDLFFAGNPSHRVLFRVDTGAGERVFVLSDSWREAIFDSRPRKMQGAGAFVADGFRHILSGYDHLAFLLLLILPQAGKDRLRQRLGRIGGIVTAFTLAHSLTLAAAMLGVVHLPSQPVEVAIAASVVVAASMNILRPDHSWGWHAALAFGLLHGFGFAGALEELTRDGLALWVALASFNVGVELGQLLVVLLALPVLTWMSRLQQYRPVLVPAASFGCALLGVAWTAARL